MTAVEVKQEIKNLKKSIELQYGLNRNGDADALAMMNWYKRLTQIESAIENLKKTTEMTAIEWLRKKLESYGDPQFCKIEWEKLDSLIQQAKEMEKEQIMDAVEWGNRKGYDEHRLTCILDEDEDYYNETYKPSA